MIYSLESTGRHFVQRHQHVPALSGITLQVAPGETMALLGQSGAGKTTLFRLLNGTLRPSAGILRFEGRDTTSFSARELRAMRCRVGTIYQQHNLVPSLTALENTLCGALGRMSLRRTFLSAVRPAKTDLEQAEHALELVGLADKRKSRADELSGGQQQRLAAARVLMQAPDVILADEPTASLDPGLAEAITSLLIRLAQEGSRTLIMAVHKVELAREHFPRVVGLRAGCLAFDARPSEVRQDLIAALYYRDSNQLESDDGNHIQPRPGCR